MSLLVALGLLGAAVSDPGAAYISNGAGAKLVLQRAHLALTPPELLPLGGYTARGGKVVEPGGEDLFVRVAVLSQGDVSVALASLEMLTVPESLVAKVKEKLPPGTNLFMVATHTHCAPDSQMLNSRMTITIPGIATYKERWLDWYSDKIASAILAARSAPKSTPSLFVSEFKPGLNRARREHGFPDPWVRSVSADMSADPTPVRWSSQPSPLGEGLVTVYAAHSTIHDDKRNQTSGDWPGEIMRRTNALIFPGAIGDASPAAPDDNAPSETKIKQFADRWQTKSRTAEKSPLKQTLTVDEEKIDLQAPDLHPDFARANGVPTAIAKRLLESFAPKDATITAVKIGDVVLLGIPGEPTSHAGRRIAEIGRRNGLRVWPISHCNGWIGYIVDPADYLLNGYEATLTMYGPGTANRVTDAAERLIKRITTKS